MIKNKYFEITQSNDRRLIWSENSAWKQLYMYISSVIKNKLLESDKIIFSNYYDNTQQLFINSTELSKHVLQQFIYLNGLSSDGQQICKKYMKIIGDGAMDYADSANIAINFSQLFIIVFHLWHKLPFELIYKDVEKIKELYTLLSKELNYASNQDLNFIAGVTNYGSFGFKIECLIRETDGKEKFKPLVENVEDMLGVYNIYNEKQLAKQIKEQSKPVEIKTQEKSATIKKGKLNLDNYKIVGLKELCLKLQLNTSKCRLRQDYIDLLHKHGV